MFSLFPAASAPRSPYSATELTANVQTAAGIISLLNDLLVSNRKQPFGFINPWLYSDGFKGIKDIKLGSNPGCNTVGFVAADGWDPVRSAPIFNFSEPFSMLAYMVLYNRSRD